jgi:hypothetical protein
MDAKTAAAKAKQNFESSQALVPMDESQEREFKAIVFDIEHAVFHGLNHVKLWIYYHENVTKLKALGYKIDDLDDSARMVMW